MNTDGAANGTLGWLVAMSYSVIVEVLFGVALLYLWAMLLLMKPSLVLCYLLWRQLRIFLGITLGLNVIPFL